MKIIRQKKVPAWAPEPLGERLLRCVSMLVIHDILPQHQRDAAMTRIVRRFKEQPSPSDTKEQPDR